MFNTVPNLPTYFSKCKLNSEALQFFDSMQKMYNKYDWLNHKILREDTLLIFQTILDDSEIIAFDLKVEVDESNVVVNAG